MSESPQGTRLIAAVSAVSVKVFEQWLYLALAAECLCSQSLRMVFRLAAQAVFSNAFWWSGEVIWCSLGSSSAAPETARQHFVDENAEEIV